MQTRNNKLKVSLTSGFAKGWKGFIWMLKILLPISFLTFLLAWSGLINRLDFILEPVMAASWFMGYETYTSVLANNPVIIQEPLSSMLKTWTVETMILSGKILVIIVTLMVVLEAMKNYRLIDRIIHVMSPVLKVLGLGKETGFLWLTAVVFGLTYGAAVIVEEAREGHLSKDELERLHISIGINHSIIEDPLLFLSLGLGVFWMVVPRLAAAIIAVHCYILFKRVISLPRFSKVF